MYASFRVTLRMYVVGNLCVTIIKGSIIYGTVVGFICLKYYVPFCGCVGRSKGGQTRKGQIGTEGYQEMGRKGGLSTNEESGRERAEREGIPIDESKFRNKS